MARDILRTRNKEHAPLRELFRELKETTDRGVKKRAGMREEVRENRAQLDKDHGAWKEPEAAGLQVAENAKSGLKQVVRSLTQ